MRGITLSAITLVLSAVGLSTAHAVPLPVFADPGTANTAVYTFSVAETGPVTAYFAGSDAGNESVLGFFSSSGLSGSGFLPNHDTAVGTSYTLGTLNKGDVLTFFIDTAGSNRFFSDPSLNTDNTNHVFAATYGGDADMKLPSGLYVAFEDLPRGGDFDYNDVNFVLTNTVSAVPLPASAPLFGAAVLALGLVGYGRRARKAAAVTVR